VAFMRTVRIFGFPAFKRSAEVCLFPNSSNTLPEILVPLICSKLKPLYGKTPASSMLNLATDSHGER